MYMLIRLLLVLQFLLLYPLMVFCQGKLTLQGTVKTHRGDTLAEVTINTPSERFHSLSGGHYTIRLNPGLNRVQFSYAGCETLDTSIDLRSDRILDIYLLPKMTVLQTVGVKTVRSKSDFSRLNSTETGKLEIPLSELKKVPAIGGETDLIKAIQLTPGIKKGTEGGVGMYVRGGGNDQNLILLDDAVIYNAGHLLGFFSVFNVQAIRDMSVYKSGFPSQYGGRLSSVLDIRTKDGSMKKSSMEGTFGTISSNMTVQGPIVKNKSSFIVSARRSYIDQGFKLLGKELPMYFYDLNAKISFRLGSHDQLYFSSYYGRDVMHWSGKIKVKDTSGNLGTINNLNVKSNSDLGNFTNTLKWSHRVPAKRLSYSAALLYSNFNYTIDGTLSGGNLYVHSGIRDLGGKMDVNRQVSSALRLNYGFSTVYRMFSPNMVSSSGSISDLKKSQQPVKNNNIEHAAYVQSEQAFSARLSASYGLRVSSLTTHSGKTFAGLEPRVNFRYRVDSSNTFKFSYSRMKQYVHLISSSSMAMPTDLWYPVTDKARPELSDQVTLGYYTDFHKKGLYFSTEVYYKSLRNIIEFREGASLILNDDFENELLLGKGHAYGAEMFLHYTADRFSGWIGYTLAWSSRQFDSINNGERYFSKYDRRHDLSLVGNYRISDKWSVSGTWIFSTGNPFTAKIGQYVTVTPNRNDVITLPVYSHRNDHRFSASHRLDIDVCYKMAIARRYSGELHISMYNVYNRTQPSRVEVAKDSNGNYKFQQKGLFGAIPALSFNFKF
jgi:hypothetical protein